MRLLFGQDKITLAFIILLVGFEATAKANYHHIGAAPGYGTPGSLKGGRINYQYPFKDWHRFSLLGDASYAHWWSNRSYTLNVFAAAIWLQYRGGEIYEFHPFVHASIGGAKKSTKTVGNGYCGSKWTFQDIIGMGFQLNKNWAISASWMHYSNGSLAPPNPGIDFIPLINLTYKIS